MIVWPFSGAERLIGIIGVGLVGAVYLFESQFSALSTAIGFIIVALDAAAGQFPEVGFIGPTLMRREPSGKRNPT